MKLTDRKAGAISLLVITAAILIVEIAALEILKLWRWI